MALGSLFACSCNNSGSTEVKTDSGAVVSSDSTKAASDSTAAKVDTAAFKVDTGTAVTPPDTSTKVAGYPLKRAVLGYSYFKSMKRKETRYIHAVISIVHPESNVRDTLKILNTQDGLERGNDTSSIFTRNMSVYRYVDVQLVNAEDSAFKIVKIHDSSRQEIDTLAGNHWEWAVTPVTDNGTGILVLKVVAEKPNGSRESFEAQSIPITIEVNLDIFRRVWNWMQDNPGKVLTLILIPVIGFLFRRYVFKGKGDKGSGNNNNEES